MAHRLPANSYSGSGAKTIQRAEIGIPSREKHVVILAFGSAEETKFVEFVIHPGFIEYCRRDEAAWWKADGQAVRADSSIDVVCRLAAAAAGHVFRHDIRPTGNMLFQIGQYGFQPRVSQPSRFLAADHSDGLALIKRRLGQRRGRLA